MSPHGDISERDRPSTPVRNHEHVGAGRRCAVRCIVSRAQGSCSRDSTVDFGGCVGVLGVEEVSGRRLLRLNVSHC